MTNDRRADPWQPVVARVRRVVVRRSRSVRSVVGLAVAGLVLASCGGEQLADVDVRADGEGVVAPGPGDVLVDGGWPEVAAFVEEAADGDHATVVNLFGSWCEPCAEELPMMLATSRGTSEVRWLGVAVQDVERNARPFVDELEVTWPSVLDVDASTFDALEGRVMPTTAFFDREGELVEIVHGILDQAMLDDALRRVQA